MNERYVLVIIAWMNAFIVTCIGLSRGWTIEKSQFWLEPGRYEYHLNSWLLVLLAVQIALSAVFFVWRRMKRAKRAQFEVLWMCLALFLVVLIFIAVILNSPEPFRG